MAWVNPKLSWISSDYFNADDYNRIKNNALYLLGPTESTSGEFLHSLIVSNVQRTMVYAANRAPSISLRNINTSPISGTPLYKPYGITTYEIFNAETGTRTNRGTLRSDRNGIVPATMFSARPYRQRLARVEYTFQWGLKGVPDDIPDVGSDKAINDLLYADEMNNVIDLIDWIAEFTKSDFKGKPFYFPNGDFPKAVELNTIERELKNLYNRIGREYSIYMGISGSLGSRITNVRL